jgi:hypothetical protein
MGYPRSNEQAPPLPHGRGVETARSGIEDNGSIDKLRHTCATIEFRQQFDVLFPFIGRANKGHCGPIPRQGCALL